MKFLPLEQEMSTVASRMYVKKKKCVNQWGTLKLIIGTLPKNMTAVLY